MPWSADQKPRTRRQILDAAATLFTRHGFEGASIDDVMCQAGLTRGAFYAHFASKGELYAEALGHAARSSVTRLNDAEPHERVLGYLSEGHRRGDDVNCPLACLVSDVAQQDERVRAAYTRLFAGFVAHCQPAGEDRRRSLQRAVTMIGGMAIARTLSDDALAEEVLDACRDLAGAASD
ncbi:TetR/AcrR family transcriptional regulator [Halomonas organivorans]|uniref:TetR/AcrR family transcriptional repressor of nem operon n=1 Tax=Halomonas organivorans TaxID=257772 RepID=A0A7W5C322_9GAMM|nr:TetR/AcrR family transcriptional regulator [Halomonas organivorans]MBB3143423.1 TetR/AcrR family transcriptional repressor of nem operon [Halomonas organivorans]